MENPSPRRQSFFSPKVRSILPTSFINIDKRFAVDGWVWADETFAKTRPRFSRAAETDAAQATVADSADTGIYQNGTKLFSEISAKSLGFACFTAVSREKRQSATNITANSIATPDILNHSTFDKAAKTNLDHVQIRDTASLMIWRGSVNSDCNLIPFQKSSKGGVFSHFNPDLRSSGSSDKYQPCDWGCDSQLLCHGTLVGHEI